MGATLVPAAGCTDRHDLVPSPMNSAMNSAMIEHMDPLLQDR